MKAPCGRARWSRLARCTLVFVIEMRNSFRTGAAFAEGSVSYEVRQQITGALLLSHDYGVSGSCATGTGLAPASLYAQGGSARGAGLGAGVGGRLGYRSPISGGQASGPAWWGLRAQVGLDLDLLYGKIDTGLADTAGKLCARIRTDGVDVQYRESPILFAQVPLVLGAEVGLGKDGEDGSWHGIVLGAAWAVAVGYLMPWTGGGDFTASYLGGELTLDFATLHTSTGHEASERAAVFFLLPTQDHGPVVLTISFGAVWH